MGKAVAKPYVKFGVGKETLIGIAAPAGVTFLKNTDVNSCEDAQNSTLTWTARRVGAKPGESVMRVKLTGKGPGTHGRPDSGSLSITLSDPPSGVSATAEPNLDVHYVEDI